MWDFGRLERTTTTTAMVNGGTKRQWGVAPTTSRVDERIGTERAKWLGTHRRGKRRERLTVVVSCYLFSWWWRWTRSIIISNRQRLMPGRCAGPSATAVSAAAERVLLLLLFFGARRVLFRSFACHQRTGAASPRVTPTDSFYFIFFISPSRKHVNVRIL